MTGGPEGNLHLRRGYSVIGRAGVVFVHAANEGAVLDPGDIWFFTKSGKTGSTLLMCFTVVRYVMVGTPSSIKKVRVFSADENTWSYKTSTPGEANTALPNIMMISLRLSIVLLFLRRHDMAQSILDYGK